MRARLELRVIYDAPAFDCRRVLRVLPRADSPPAHQTVAISPSPTLQSERRDRFGNRVLHLHHARIEREFGLSFSIDAGSCSPSPNELLEAGTIGAWKLPSRAVAFSPELLAMARDFRALPPMQRAGELNRFVFDSLEYTAQTSASPANATGVWTQKRGSCADFAHVMLALGRASGLPSRYVAGFGPAPGALHAWVEFGINGSWHAFDPTHGRSTEGLYLPVAVGRDFYDCAPHQGSFRGGNAQLELHCELRQTP